jgi:hypothetical protein
VLKSEKKTINGSVYQVTTLPYGVGKRVLLRLCKVCGPTVAKAFAAAPDLRDKDLGDLQVAAVTPALAAAVEQLVMDLDEDSFDMISDALAGATVILEGDKQIELSQVREVRFAGNYGEMLQWLAFALKVNFFNFSGGLGQKMAAALAHVQTPQA